MASNMNRFAWTQSLEPKSKPGEWLEYSPLLTILVAGLLCWYLVDVFRTSPQGALAALDLNTYNLMFITVGLLLHWRPKRFMRAVAECIPAAGGVLIQFPFYAVIFGMIVGTGIADSLRLPSCSLRSALTTPIRCWWPCIRRCSVFSFPRVAVSG